MESAFHVTLGVLVLANAWEILAGTALAGFINLVAWIMSASVLAVGTALWVMRHLL